MRAQSIVITGLGSVSPLGVVQGHVEPRAVHPRPITRWPTPGLRRAYQVDPFRPEDVVKGLRTRRLDRLSVWCLVAAALAMRDADLNLESADRSRIAVVCGTGFGCLELTEACLKSIDENACGKSDPILFPETLSNAPGSHVARTYGLRGPNVTVSAKGTSGECALAAAQSLLDGEEADAAIVISGDALARSAYEWCEAARCLSSACFEEKPAMPPFSAGCDGFVPGEGVGAVVLESGRRFLGPKANAYAYLSSVILGRDTTATSTSWGKDPQAFVKVAARAIGDSDPPALLLASANGSPSLDLMEAEAIRSLKYDPESVFAAKAFLGEFDGNAILRMVLTLSHPAPMGGVILLGSAAGGDRAAVTLETA